MRPTAAIAWVAMTVLIMSTGCLRTRDEIRGAVAQKEIKQQTVEQVQAQEELKEQEINTQIRELRGRVEVLEAELAKADRAEQENAANAERRTTEVETRFKAYEEALLKLEAQLQELSAQVAALKSSSGTTNASAKKKSSYEIADELFEQKKWKEAILAFQKYRDANPKGAQYESATYKIGVCFQELGMKNEARAFFEEVIEKYPKGKIAPKAKYRLKSLK